MVICYSSSRKLTQRLGGLAVTHSQASEKRDPTWVSRPPCWPPRAPGNKMPSWKSDPLPSQITSAKEQSEAGRSSGRLYSESCLPVISLEGGQLSIQGYVRTWCIWSFATGTVIHYCSPELFLVKLLILRRFLSLCKQIKDWGIA